MRSTFFSRSVTPEPRKASYWLFASVPISTKLDVAIKQGAVNSKSAVSNDVFHEATKFLDYAVKGARLEGRTTPDLSIELSAWMLSREVMRNLGQFNDQLIVEKLREFGRFLPILRQTRVLGDTEIMRAVWVRDFFRALKWKGESDDRSAH